MPDPTRTYRRQAMLNTKSLLEHFQFIKQSVDLIQNSVKPNRGFLLTSACLDRRLRAVTLEITFASLRIKVLLIFKFHYTKSSDAFSDTSSMVPVQSCLYPFRLRDYSACQEEALPLQPCLAPTFSLCPVGGCSGSPAAFPCPTRLPLWRPEDGGHLSLVSKARSRRRKISIMGSKE